MTQQYQVNLERTANAPVSEGIHIFTVIEAEETTSSSQNPMWVFTLACQTPTEAGKEVRLFLPLTQNMRWKLELFLDAMRAPGSGTVTADRFVGRQMRASIKHEDYQGRPQAQINEMFALSQAPAGAPAARSATSGKPAPGTTPAAPAAPAVSAPVKKTTKKVGLPADVTPAADKSNDDIPF